MSPNEPAPPVEPQEPNSYIAYETAKLKGEAVPTPESGRSDSEEAPKPQSEAAPAETEPDPEPGAQTQEQKTDEGRARRRDRSAEQRIARLTSQNKALEQRLADVERGRPQGQPEPPPDPQAPKAEDYPDTESYIDARVVYKLKAEKAQAATEALVKGATDRWQSSEPVAREAHDDFEDVAYRPEMLALDANFKEFGPALGSTEFPAETAYAIGADSELLKQLPAMDSITRVAAIGCKGAEVVAAKAAAETSRDPDPAPEPPKQTVPAAQKRTLHERSARLAEAREPAGRIPSGNVR